MIGALALLFLTSACVREARHEPVIGEAFAGPSTLNIRRDIPMQSPVAGTVKHGDRLEILQRRRAFFRVRARHGAEGWVDERNLLSASDMDNLKRLAQTADKLPSQGAATPRFGDTRIYTLPSREAPSFITVKDKENVDVLAHVSVPRVKLTRAPILPPTPKTVIARKKPREGAIPPVPAPKPPPLPANWQDLSRTEADEPPDPEPAAPPPPDDDWCLVRTSDGEAGWTLTRRLEMAIPDEVAQYAEGRRIVSYFSLGTVQDGDQKKNIWVWTTVGGGTHNYDFDNFRVFVWSLRHHRYETSYIERNVVGYEPVTLETVTYSGAKYPGFSVCTLGKDGTKSRREFALLSNVVRYAGARPCEAQTPAQQLAGAIAPSGANAAAPPGAPVQQKGALVERIKLKMRALLSKYSFHK